MNKTLHTKWGKSNICHDGYYRITSRKEDNNGKKWYRLKKTFIYK